MKRYATLLLCLCLAAGCVNDRPPEETTPDGLVRVPSRKDGGVYRAPATSFNQYKRMILEAPSINFLSGWRDTHREVSDAEVARIRAEITQQFRKEFTRHLVKYGPYEMADEPAPDVLLVSVSILDLDIPAPDVAVEPGMKSFAPGPVQMTLSGELHDSTTGKLLSRVIMFKREERYGFNEMRVANRVTNAHEQGISFADWSRLLRESLDLAKAESPRQREITSAPR